MNSQLCFWWLFGIVMIKDIARGWMINIVVVSFVIRTLLVYEKIIWISPNKVLNVHNHVRLSIIQHTWGEIKSPISTSNSPFFPLNSLFLTEDNFTRYVEQLVASAEAAVQEVIRRGVSELVFFYMISPPISLFLWIESNMIAGIAGSDPGN